MLGMVVGVGALVAILAVADGAEGWSRRQIFETTTLQALLVESVTSEVVGGVRVQRADVVVMTPGDLEDLEAHLGRRARAWLDVARPVRLEPEPGGRARGAVVHGVTGTGPFERSELSVGRGLVLEDFTANGRTAVVNESLGRSLAGPDSDFSTLLGREVSLGSGTVRVVGVERGRATPEVFVPFALFERLLPPKRDLPSLVVEALRLEDMPMVTQEVEGWLRQRFGSLDGLRMITQRERLAQVRQGLLVLRLVLGTIVGISVVVGGVGIMNVLLGAVARRTREIGIRKALGARGRDILTQFLAEAVAVTVLGAAIGVILGTSFALVATALIRSVTKAELYASVTAGPPIVAGVVALAVGVAFGAYPALRAARLPPIDAIRYE